MNQNITLQINISPGDINYALLTVPELVKKYNSITQRLLVVDCCRPQKTKIVNPDIKYPTEEFANKVSKIKEIAIELKDKCGFSEVFILESNSPIIKIISKKYLNNVYSNTHAGGGTANMSYWAAIHLPKTRYVIHLDGDMIMYSDPNYNWVTEALELLKMEKNAIFAVPRLCPPIAKNLELPSHHEGRKFQTKENYWLNDWFSTRHFLIDKEKLQPFLPLITGKIKFETLLRKWLNRVYPFDPEIVLFKKFSLHNLKRVILKSEKTWFLHPQNKAELFNELLPEILKEVNMGNFPEDQAGYEDLKLESWLKFLRK